MEEVKIVYHIDEEPTPYLIKVTPSDRSGKVVLGDFRAALNAKAHSYKYFFKTVDDDFGVVKEELVDDSSVLPCANGRIVAWLVTADGSQQAGAGPGSQGNGGHYVPPPHAVRLTDQAQAQLQRLTGLSMQQFGNDDDEDDDGETLDDEDLEGDGTDRQDELAPLDAFDAYRARFGAALASQSGQTQRAYLPSTHAHQHAVAYYQQAYPVGVPVGVPPNMLTGRGNTPLDTASSLASSDVDETVSFLESEAESSRMSTATGTTTTMSWIAARGTRKQLRRRRKAAPMSRASSFSSMTDSTMSLNIITVTLNVDACNFLGISIVGQSSRSGGDGGIYVGSIMKGGAVAQDGRIEPGDMLLEVNGISFECMTNDEAVRALREAVAKPGPITLVVAKCWDARPNPKGYFTVPKQEPVRPIDPRAWIAHTQAAQSSASQNGGAAANGGADRDGMTPNGGADHTFGTGPLSASLQSSVTSGNSGGPQVSGPMHYPAPSTIIDSVSTAMEYRGGPPRMPAPPPVNQRPHPSHPHPNVLTHSQHLSESGYLPNQPLENGSGLVPTAGSGAGSIPGPNGEVESEGDSELVRLSTRTDLTTIVQALAQPDSGLEIRDRIWLKITIPNAFIGSDLVDWLYTHVDGLQDRRDAKKLAAALVRARLIRHTVNKSSFSEKCYYVLSDAALRFTVPSAPVSVPVPVPVPNPVPAQSMPIAIPNNPGYFVSSGPFMSLVQQQMSMAQPQPQPQPGFGNLNDPTLDEIDSVSDIGMLQKNVDSLRWPPLSHNQRQAQAQALQQAYANAPVQPGAAKSNPNLNLNANPYARYVSNPLFTSQTQQYATPILSNAQSQGQQPIATNSGPPPSYLESQFALNHASNARAGPADNGAYLKQLKPLLGAKENDQPAGASSSNGNANGNNEASKGAGKQKPPPVPVRSCMPPGNVQLRAANAAGTSGDIPPLADSASVTSTSSAGTTSSCGDRGAVNRRAPASEREQSQAQAVAMMSHFAGNSASGPQQDALDRLPLGNGANGNTNPNAGNGGSAAAQSSLFSPSVLTQIAT